MAGQAERTVMNRQLFILSVLYDLAITIGKESRVEPLIEKFLQKLMFHTGYPAGVFLSRQGHDTEQSGYRVEASIGDDVFGNRDKILSLPETFASQSLVDPDLSGICERGRRYRHSLWLPVADEGGVLLLTHEMQPSEMPLAQMFDPVLRNFAHALQLCRFNENHLAELEDRVSDATQHLNLEKEKYSKLLLSMPDAVVITDSRGTIEMINRSTELLFGYSAYELLGEPVEILVPERYRSDHTSLVSRYMTEPEARMMASMRRLAGRKKNGDTFPASISLNPVMIKDKRQIIASIRDMTEYEALMSQFQQAQKMEALGTLVGGISHDFNNLISTIMANTYLAKEELEENETVVEKLTAIEEQAIAAAEMIQQLLAFARKDSIKMRQLSLTSLIRKASKLYRSAIPLPAKLSLDLPKEDLMVNGNAVQLQQVLLNLLNNARDAVKGAPEQEVRVDLRRVDISDIGTTPKTGFTSRHYACLSVTDTGHGIPKHMVQQIFDPFFTTKPVEQGTGLGLAMVYGTVESHNGLIEVESGEGKGTQFRLYFPLLETSEPVAG